ncbi:hypothetical protein TDB9533_01194 [Thalassocella blandensis]|nr:hypothetical protein TDB9533_01194 [Thalassocella blandensis]
MGDLDFTLGRDALVLSVALLVTLVVVIIVLFVRLNKVKAGAAEQTQREVELTGLHLQQEFAATLNKKDLELAQSHSMSQQLQQRLQESQEKVSDLSAVKDEYIQLQARMSEREEALKEREKLLNQTKEALFKEFELTANRLFDAKHEVFEKQSRTNVESVLKPFREQLKAFGERVNQVYDQESSQRNQLVGQIVELQKQTQRVSSEADSLAKALKGDNKIQGNWGEVILERLLEQSGLSKGREYDTQVSLKDAQGKVYRPDVVIRLPDGKDIIVDAKMSLKEYDRFCSSEEESERHSALKLHIESIRKHINGLSDKRYEQLEGINVLDFVFIFIPIESAFNLAVQAQPGLLSEAAEKRVLLVSPTSILVALRTIETLWRHHKQNQNAEKIALSAGRLYDQFVLVMNAMEDLGNSLGKANNSYNQVLNRFAQGRGNMLKKMENLKDLGAKTTRVLSDSYEDKYLESQGLQQLGKTESVDD